MFLKMTNILNKYNFSNLLNSKEEPPPEDTSYMMTYIVSIIVAIILIALIIYVCYSSTVVKLTLSHYIKESVMAIK
jgi:hypothetical protein